MAKIRVVKGKVAPTKRNAIHYAKVSIPYLNSISIIYILLRMFNILK